MPGQSQILKMLKREWGRLAQIATWIMVVIGSFLYPPPAFSAQDQKTWQHLGQFSTAIVIGVLLVAGHRWKLKKHRAPWSIFAGVSLIAAVSAFFMYQHLLYSRTCSFGSDTKIIGTEYTSQGRHYVESRPDISCQQLLTDFVGKANDVWTDKSIDDSSMLLAIVYLLCLPLFTFALFGIIQSMSLTG